jgi:hypothetical protein
MGRRLEVSESQAPSQAPAPPPFDPDPELVDHLEGNASERRRYRDEIEALRKTSQTEEPNE